MPLAFVLLLQTGGVFRDTSASSGIDYVNIAGDLDKRYIVSTLGSGVALFDYDEDSDLDVYFANGLRIVGEKIRERGSDRLYRNDGGFLFTDVTEASGLGRSAWSLGVAAADYDNDGLADLYVTRIGENQLYRNRGDGTFDEVGPRAGVNDSGWGTSAAFFDADRDGDLDLYTANYVAIDLEALPPPRCQWFGLAVMCGPKGLPGRSDVFYRNGGDGTFSDETFEAGLLDPTGAYGLGVVTGDYDDDGDLDVYVANDSVPNFLYRNDGRGRFEEVAFLAGAALSPDGLAQAGMGVDMGDLDGNGHLDLFITNFSHETNNIYLNQGEGIFLDAVGEANLHGPSWFALGWGTRLVDLDNDSDLDIFVANGHVYPGVDESNLKTTYRQPNQIFWNDGRGGFSEQRIPGEAMSSRAAAFGDLDNDGDVDGVIVNIDGPATILENETVRGGSWVNVRLIGTLSPRDAIGALVILGRRSREVHPSGSFLSSNDPRVPVDTGTAGRVIVRWPHGLEESYGPIESGREITLVEGGALLQFSSLR